MRGSLHHARDFRRLYSHGRRARRGAVAVVVAPRSGGGRSRLGLAVKATGGAVARNRLRRRLRAAFRACAVAPGFDVLVRASGSEVGGNFQHLVEDLGIALREAGAEVRRS